MDVLCDLTFSLSFSIDTPGVIQRVSRLFHGNPYLIQGFNTFLPVGYRIDISVDPSDPNTITVTTPMGTTTQTTNASVARPGLPPPGLVNASLHPAGVPHLQNVVGGPDSRPMTPHGFQPGHGQPVSEPISSPSLHHPQTTAAASFLNKLNNKNTIEKQPPGEEFNHAILYLNKIKARYADEPNVYKQFLDILQTYQKEQKHVQDVGLSCAHYSARVNFYFVALVTGLRPGSVAVQRCTRPTLRVQRFLT